MSLSLDSVHQALSAYFINRFETDETSPVFFRFDKVGSVISEKDFIDPGDPVAYSSALAREELSELVNRLPVDVGDGINVVLTADSIDSTYFDRLVAPSRPYIPKGATQELTESVISTFSKLKARANLLWTSMTLESSKGLLQEFHPAEATPENWFDPENDEVWTSASFDIGGKEEGGPKGDAGKKILWRFRPDEQFLAHVMELEESPASAYKPHDVDFPEAAGHLSGTPASLRSVVPHSLLNARAGVAGALPDSLRIRDHRTGVALPNEADAESESTSVLSHRLADRFVGLDIPRRLQVQQIIEENTPTDIVRTDKMSVSFEYCLVSVKRPWYVDTFINDTSWYVPGHSKGELTAGGSPGNLTLISIAFVILRKLSIQAPWSDEDRRNALSAVSIGPFRVADDGHGQLTHSGLQVVGWMLQLMPQLPPNTDDVGAVIPQQPSGKTYTVIEGDTLWSIAAKMYGDPTRWPEILQANENSVPAPQALSIGQVLIIP
ncbi:LysM peptidoglycan-binding domain-containing protein [Arthrobacter sp. DNA4]|uniref:LysM peptidoglycan-binding domain-containing protein n=1 Tax=Arthrobacter sp. DNA4 TaxID=2963432 RepID=UPI0020CF2A91|nr:LysM domain-containing protein [Arthrobacter sp. DNA4]UTT71289.1 LysM peptidoglycan-binding domain-containing protein [Arthrobacter sp. DNA4]